MKLNARVLLQVPTNVLQMVKFLIRSHLNRPDDIIQKQYSIISAAG